MTGADLLGEIGRALYAGDWHQQLADQLGVTRRTVQRWDRGAAPVPAGVWADLAAALDARARELPALAERARKAAGA